MVEVVATISGIAGAGFLFHHAWKSFGKEKYPTSTMLSIIGAGLLLCSFPWFQGFVKTWLTGYVNSRLSDLGMQVNEVQNVTTGMHGQLSTHQEQIDKHQKELDVLQGKIRESQKEISDSQVEITNQYSSLSIMQLNLATIQTNIETQQKKIEDVEYLVQNLFSKTEDESIDGSDTNRVIVARDWGEVKVFGFRLSHAAIPNSIQGIASGGGFVSQFPILPIRISDRNIFFSVFKTPGIDLKKATFNFRYVDDTRITNLVKTLQASTTNTFYIDGKECIWPD